MWLPFSLLNALFESASNVFSKKALQKVGIVSTSWASRFFSLFILIPLVILTKSFKTVNTTFLLVFRKVSIGKILSQSKSLAPIGICSGLSSAFQMIAISLTIVPNAIAVKRLSILFGVIWGRLFFKETNIRERLAGAVIMVLGVILITLG